MKKKISGLILLLSVIVTLLSPNVINASELDDNMGTRAGPIVYKTNVQNYEEWGSYARVSDNVKISTGQSMTISSDRTVSFSRTISGTTSGLTIAANQTISSRKGYALQTSTAGTWYLVYRAKYKVESGIRNYQPGNGGPTTTNSYTVKVPYYGEYKLIKY